MRMAACALSLCALLPVASAQDLAPRRPLPKTPVVAAPFPDAPGVYEHRLHVKFADAARVRADGAGVVSRGGADLAGLRAVESAFGLTFDRLVKLPDAKLRALEQRAAARSGRAQPDLAGIYRVLLPDTSPAALEAAGAALNALDVIEWAQVEIVGCPPPGDIAPPTPDLTSAQGYLGPDPGVNAEYAWAQGVTGAGVRLSDCEYGWRATHEDIVDKDTNPEPGQTIAAGVIANGWDEHGTAVIGETSAVPNRYGVTGIAPDAELATYTEWSEEEGLRRVTAITNAIADSDPGDVVLLEMQTGGVDGSFVPAEYSNAVHTVVAAGTAAGVVVVAAAGNGNVDLDAPEYAPYMAKPDSGAIIVGAGTASVAHSKLSFSTYGSRVNLQGWGEGVMTMGYGFFAEYGGDPDQRYIGTFSGTSSASPFVAAVCCLVQQHATSLLGEPLDPLALRQLLTDTGTPQGTGGNIGPFVDAQAAIESLAPVWTELGGGLAGWFGIVPQADAMGTLLPNTAMILELTQARFYSPAFLVIGADAIDAPFKGGTMVPAPDFLVAGLQTDFVGNLTLVGTFPSNVPAGVTIYHQWWIQDAGAPKGLSASNAVLAVSP